ncbi:hypothetical protein GCM10027048_42830 [Hymenobacter coalescens]
MTFRQPVTGGLLLDARIGPVGNDHPLYPATETLHLRAGLRAATARHDAQLRGTIGYVEAGISLNTHKARHRQRYVVE